MMNLLGLALAPSALADPGQDAKFYRELTFKVRPQGSFRILNPGSPGQPLFYSLSFGAPRFDQPLMADFPLSADGSRFYRHFWDKILLLDGSYLMVGDEKLPLTCIYISGQDNRFSQKDSPLTPDFILRVYLVANDFSCTGPINPGWPSNGAKKETWNTFLYFEIRDPTIMLPADTEIRYRWAELPAVWVDAGGGSL